MIRLAKEYVCVTGDDWYQRRRQDAEGKFFRAVADQGPLKGEGGSTRQGIYCLTADGKLLAYKNTGQSPEATIDLLERGISEWRKLPKEPREPGAIQVGEPGTLDSQYSRVPPKNGLILNVFTRALERSSPSLFVDARCEVGKGDEVARDYLWIKEDELKKLLPREAKKGDRFPVPSEIALRILRFHLVDNTRGEPPYWAKEQLRSHRLEAVVEKVSSGEIRLRLEGQALLATSAEVKNSDRGYDASLLGFITYHPNTSEVKEFDLIALGEHWGEGAHTRRARPGRTPLGVLVTLPAANKAPPSIPPQAAREIGPYFGDRE